MTTYLNLVYPTSIYLQMSSESSSLVAQSDIEQNVALSRTDVVKQYMAYRVANNVDQILELFSPDFVMVDSDSAKTEFTGEVALRKFFADRPAPMVAPWVSDPVTNADGTVSITLSAVVKKLYVTFSFNSESNLIQRIVLVEGDVLGGWF